MEFQPKENFHALGPLTRTGAPNERAERLADAIKVVPQDAIKAGGSPLRRHRHVRLRDLLPFDGDRELVFIRGSTAAGNWVSSRHLACLKEA